MGTWGKWKFAVGVATAMVGTTTSCANVLGIEDTSLEENEAPPPVGRDWRCVGKVPDVRVSQPIQISAIITAFDGTPLSGLTVKACAFAANPSCSNPISSAVSGAEGIATLEIPSRVVPYTGYLRLEGDETRVPYVSYYSRPITETLPDPIPFLSVTWEEINAVIPGGHIDDRGHLFINATDCQNVDAPGIQFKIKTETVVDDQSMPFYMTTSGFSTDATQTIGGPQVGGRGGMFNLNADKAPLLVKFEAFSEDTDGAVSWANWFIFKNTLTTGRLLPK